MKQLKLATSWRVKVTGNKRSIELLDANGDVITGDARWEGDFSCPNNQLTSLEGAPKEVGGGFYCSSNQLTSLKGAPKEVGGYFSCPNNQLTSLEGAPKEVGGYFSCYNNQLTSLEGAPKEVGGGFSCYNNQLTSLEGAPKEVGGYFYCDNNQLTSLEGAPKEKSDTVASRIFKAKLKRGYLLADGILQKLAAKKKVGRLTVFKARSIGLKKTAFVVYDGKVFSHGKTVKEARESLMYKLADRDTSKYASWKASDVKPLEELVQSYRAITGACEFGVKEFVSSLKKRPAKLKVSQVFELTAGKYGAEQYKQFFKGAK